MVACWSRSFDGKPEQAFEARQFVREVIGNHEGADAVVLVASELVGNAIQHSLSGREGGIFVLYVAEFTNRWAVRVDDNGGPARPHIRTLPADGSIEDLDMLGCEVETGRGLAIVAAVSAQWGVLGDDRARAVWAEILKPDAPMLGDDIGSRQPWPAARA